MMNCDYGAVVKRASMNDLLLLRKWLKGEVGNEALREWLRRLQIGQHEGDGLLNQGTNMIKLRGKKARRTVVRLDVDKNGRSFTATSSLARWLQQRGYDIEHEQGSRMIRSNDPSSKIITAYTIAMWFGFDENIKFENGVLVDYPDTYDNDMSSTSR